MKLGRKIIGLAIKKKNLFILDISPPLRIMLVKNKGQLTYLLSKNPQLKL